MSNKMTIKEIIKGNYKVTEKETMLKELKKQLNDEIDAALFSIKDGYKYCPYCKEYYKEKAWEKEEKTEIRNVCTYHSLAEFDDDTYETKECVVEYNICPMGHIIEEKVVW